MRAARLSCVPHAFFDIVRFLRTGSYSWDFQGGCGRLSDGVLRVDLPDTGITGIYVRMVDIIDNLDSEERAAASARLTALTEILATVDTLVVNRPGSDMSNWSKVYHLSLLSRCGFTVPESLLTNNEKEAREFLAAAPSTIFKGASGEKTIASALEHGQISELRLLPRSPVLFQERVRGADVRTHLVGKQHFSERIDSEGVNYQYCAGVKTFTPTRVPPDVVEKCLAYQAMSGLTFIGFDFMVGEDGRHTVLEANPMPGYDGYDRRLGLRISSALLNLLQGRGTPEPHDRRH
ncbi:ATP-grasp domain-containing protein [Streptomyces sp. NPDC003470]|uniref:ATP-grasp domain-containing protein n=1 Tax=Streptomyces sp. NPDC059701 TaxID=3346914 RepID=UPI0036CE8E63